MCMCVLSSIKSPVDRYLCVYVMKALLKVHNRARHEMYVCLRASDLALVWVCVCESAIFIF